MRNATRHPNHGGRRREMMVGDDPTVKLTLNVLPDQAAWIAEAAAQLGISRSAVLRLMVEQTIRIGLHKVE